MKNTSGMLVRMAVAILLNASAMTASAHNATSYSDTVQYLRLNEINAHAARDFTDRFPDITSQKWLRTNYGYSAKFIEGNVLSNVYYDRAGHYINTIRYYDEKTIPARFKNILRSEFSDYTIVAGTELITPKEKSFYFHIKNRKRIKTVKIVADTLEVTADYRNAEQDLVKQ